MKGTEFRFEFGITRGIEFEDGECFVTGLDFALLAIN
jgi:hypothetical protein